MESSSDGGGEGCQPCTSKIPTPSLGCVPSQSRYNREKPPLDEVAVKKIKIRPIGKENSGPRANKASSPMPLGHNRTPTPHPGDREPRPQGRGAVTGVDELEGTDKGTAATGRNPHKRIRGIWCEACNSRLVELKRQAVKYWMPFAMQQANIPAYKEAELLGRIEDKLQVPDKLRKHVFHDVCDVCQTHMQYLKGEALNMVQSLERTQSELSHRNAKMGTPRNVVQLPRTTPHFSPAHHRLLRHTPKLGVYRHHGSQQRSGVGQVAGHQGHSRIPSPYSWAYQHKTHSQMIANGAPELPARAMANMEPGATNNGMSNGAVRPKMLPLPQHYKPAPQQPPPSVQIVNTHMQAQAGPFSPGSTSSNGSGASAAASFFARAAQKLNISSRKKKKHHHHEPEPPPFPTNFSEIISVSPPAVPPCLMRAAGRLQPPGPGKVKVMLRVCPTDGNHNNVIDIDQRKKQVTVYDPLTNGYTAPSRRSGNIPPKMFAFDAIFGQDESLAEMCATSLVEIVQAVVGGADGCLFCFGHARVGKTYSMVGMDDSSQNLGIIPCAIAWLFKLINEQKDKTGARFSVRVSAVEVTGKEEQLKDLLTDVAGSQESSGGTAPGVYLREDPIVGTQLENQSELRAATADRAAYYLDAAIAARTIPDVEEDARNSHLLFTLHVYQYRVEKNAPRGSISSSKTNPTGPEQHVAGGRSRLHLIDLGSCSKSKDGNALSLSSLGNVILALLNGQRHLPHRDSKLTQLIRESLGNMSCRTCMIAHVSPAIHAYNETLQVIQLAARVHRMKRRRNKISSSSDDSSCDEGRLRSRMRVGVRMGTLREEAIYNSSGHSSGLSSDPDFTDSSEQSCDTVIYVGRNGQALSDRELTDNEGPPTMVPILHKPVAPARNSANDAASGEENKDGDSSSSPATNKDNGNKSSQGEGVKFTRPQTPKCGATMVNHCKLPPKSPARTNPSVAKPGVVQLPRKLHLKGKPPMLNKEQAGEEQWIDGPSAPTEKPGEQWIDGPCIPSAGTGQAEYSSHTLPADSWRDRPAEKASSSAPKPVKREQWVDGPPEFQVGETITTPRAQRPNKMWTGISKPEPPPRRSIKEKIEDPARELPKENHRSKRGHHEGHKTHQPLKNPQLSKLEEDKRPVSHVSVDSMNSMDANQSSRPVSIHSTEEIEPEPMPVTTFVEDWVARHSSMPHNMRHKKTRPRHANEQVTMDDMAYVLRNKKGHTQDSRLICSAQSSPRLRRLKKKEFPPPPPADADNRTLAWVQSVQEAAASKLKHLNLKSMEHSHSPAANILNSRTESQTQEGSMPECDRVIMDQDSPPPAYEHCMENTTLLEAGPVADSQVPLLHVAVPSEHGSQSGAPDQASVDGSAWREPGPEPSDQLNIPQPVQKRQKPKLDLQHLMQTNRESIYELQVDEQLESHGGSMQRLAYGSEDDVSAWNSLPKDRRSSEGEQLADEEREAESQLSPLNLNADAESGIASSGGDCHLSPPSSEDSDKRTGREIVRPSCLRRPDGASNPNLSSEDPAKPFIDSSPEDQLISPASLKSPTKSTPGLERSCDGQSPEGSAVCPSQITDSPSKSVVPSKPPTPKPSVLPKPTAKLSPSKPAPPPRTVSKLSSPTKSASSSGSNSGSSSPSKSISSFKSSKEAKNAKDKNKSKLPSPAVGSKPGSKSSTLKSAKGSGSKTKSQPSPTKTSSSSLGRETKLTSRSNSKSPSPSKRDRIPRFDTGHRSRMTDSDSGNDSGIVKNDSKLLSPYSKLTRPRISTHSSSGHGSDASSTISGLVLPQPSLKTIKSHKLEMSSGYESMVRDSEVTCTSSSSQDSPSDTNVEKRSKSTKVLKKRAVSTSRRSRSAPARTSTDSPLSSAPQSPASNKASSPTSPRAWVDTRMFPADIEDEPLEIKMYDIEDVERMARRRKEEAEMIAVELRRLKVRELLARQEKLKNELNEAKTLLMVDSRTWSFDCLVAEHGDRDDPDYLEALEKETSILEKRVEACKSRIMLVTCFDSFN